VSAKAPPGAIVGLYVDLVARVNVDDVIETRSGRRYAVLAVRVQARGKRAGRQHLRCIVIDPSADYAALIARFGADAKLHRIRWYARKKGSASAGTSRGA
jgi:hypothetical protein